VRWCDVCSVHCTMTGTNVIWRQREVSVGAACVNVVEAGAPGAPAILFLHGWPQCAESWRPVLALASRDYRAVAIDLPGIGGSTGNPTDGSKSALAGFIAVTAAELGLDELVIVGHDVGGMIAYSYLRDFSPRAAVISNTVVPGLDPWDELRANPNVWHFALHAIEGLPERLVQGNQRAYFDYFFDRLAATPGAISEMSREASVKAHGSDAALRAGFDWYRAFARDAERNAKAIAPLGTPLLYLRGDHDEGHVEDYVAGFRKVGLTNVTPGVIAGSGHFSPQEAPDATWARIAEFLRGLT
jgi:pimeloyl-ACP methyl ester carboxylesterase